MKTNIYILEKYLFTQFDIETENESFDFLNNPNGFEI